MIGYAILGLPRDGVRPGKAETMIGCANFEDQMVSIPRNCGRVCKNMDGVRIERVDVCRGVYL